LQHAEDFLDKVSAAIAKQCDTVVMEDLNVQGMIKSYHLTQPIRDASWYALKKKLK